MQLERLVVQGWVSSYTRVRVVGLILHTCESAAFYPKDHPSGHLAVYPSIRGTGASNAEGAVVIPIMAGTTAVLDADSCFHHSEQCRPGSIPEGPVQHVSPKELPGRCSLECVQDGAQWTS